MKIKNLKKDVVDELLKQFYLYKNIYTFKNNLVKFKKNYNLII